VASVFQRLFYSVLSFLLLNPMDFQFIKNTRYDLNTSLMLTRRGGTETLREFVVASVFQCLFFSVLSFLPFNLWTFSL